MASIQTSPCTLITICYNRERHLDNLLRGVAQSIVQPAEILIVEPSPSACLSAYSDLPIRSLVHALSEDGSFNVAQARNLGAEHASYEALVFLDVDCIPDPDFVGRLLAHPDANTALVMGEPRYLTAPLPEEWAMDSLSDRSIPHPMRPSLAEGSIRTDVYGFFWSLCFLIHRETLDRIGGFDEAYYGYGVEDTDMAFTARKLGIPLDLVPAIVYHQQHTVYTPPVNHFASILSNCRHFHAKWGEWPMGLWLTGFTELGLLDWSEEATEITVLKAPDQALLNKCVRPEAAFA